MAIKDDVVLVKSLPAKTKLFKSDMFLVDDSVNDTYTVNWGTITAALLEEVRKKRVGTMIIGFNTTPPSGTLLCNGALLEKSDYPELYAVLGDMFKTSEDNNDAQFRLPDMRKLFVRGADNGANKLGQIQKDAIRDIKLGTTNERYLKGSFVIARNKNKQSILGPASGAFSIEHESSGTSVPILEPSTGAATGRGTKVNFKIDIANAVRLVNNNTVANEVRPINMSVNYFIYY